jgi:hypothetical protein
MRNKNSLKSLFVAVFFLVGFLNPVFGCIWHNGTGGGYDDGSGDYGTDNSLSVAKDSMSIEAYVIRAAGYYLQSESDFRKFLSVYESKDTGEVDLQTPLRSALSNLYAAAGTFERLIRLAANTPYNQSILVRLRDFDYPGFLKANGLNPVIFAQVTAFLNSGDITGMYKKVYGDLIEVAGQLDIAADGLTYQALPTVEQLWKWSDTFTDITQFGSYAARVFAAVR